MSSGQRQDDARQIAFDAGAPVPERYDAQAELQKSSLGGQLIPRSDLQPVIDWIRDDFEEQALRKAATPRMVIPLNSRTHRQRGMQSIYLDDLQIFAQAEYWDKPGPLGFDSLRQMVEQTPVLNAIILTRIRQMSRFCRPQESRDSMGFVIRHVDSDHQLTADEQESVRLLTRFVNNCGWEFNPWQRQRLKRDTFAHFIAKSLRDSLTMDAAPIECESKRDRSLGLDGFYAVDGATVRLCTEDGYQGDDEIFAVQVVDMRVRTLYRYGDLVYQPRNPRTNVNLAGYGMGETELLVRVVTGFLNAMTYNIRGFTDNAIPRGILHLVGDYDTEDLNAFKRYWNAMVRGVNNAWTVPVLTAKDPESKAQFEKFGVEYNEMYFSKWMTFLTSLICAIYSMSPDEINFESFTAGRAPLAGADTEEKLALGRDKGQQPTMSYYEQMLSEYIIGSFSDKFCLRFVGLTPEDPKDKMELRKSVLTVDEVRAQEGYEKWPNKDGLGDAPLNPTLMQAWQAQKQAEQQAAQEDFGQAQLGEGKGGEQESGAAEAAEPQTREAQQKERGEEAAAQSGADDGKRPDFGQGKQAGDFGGKALRIYSIE